MVRQATGIRKMRIQTGAIRLAVLSRDTAFRGPKEKHLVGRPQGERVQRALVWN